MLLFLQVKNLTLQVEQESQKRKVLQADVKSQQTTITQLRSTEKRLNQVRLKRNKLRLVYFLYHLCFI